MNKQMALQILIYCIPYKPWPLIKLQSFSLYSFTLQTALFPFSAIKTALSPSSAISTALFPSSAISLVQPKLTLSQQFSPQTMFSLFQKKPEQHSQRAQMLSPRKKPLSQIFYQEKSAKLPHGFAQSIMDLEMQLQFPETYSLQAIMKLNQLYRIAIEHYIDEDPRKASHFQRKLTTLLTNPQSLELMDKKALQNKQQSANGVKSAEGQNKISAGCSYSTNLRKQISHFNCQSDILVKSIIEGMDKKVQRNHRFMESQLMTQEERLKIRLEQRSKSKKQKSVDRKP